MGGDAFTFELFGLTFNWTNIISGTIICCIVFFVCFGLSRHLQMKPTKGQNMIEWVVDFTNGITRSQMNSTESAKYSYFIFILFVFLFVANQFGLIFQFGWNGRELLKSPTADPVITLTLSLLCVTLSHFAGIAQNGMKGYLKEFVSPFALFLPIKIVEEFSNFLTLGLRIFGNIYAGELLLGLIGQVAFSHGVWTMPIGLALEVVWQGFSVFIGSIQVYVFVTLTSVYISRKVSGE